MLSAASKVYVAIVGVAAVAWVVFGHLATRADHFAVTLLVVLVAAGSAGAWVGALRVVGDTDVERPIADDAPAPALAPPAPAGPSTRPSISPFLAAAGVGAFALSSAYGSLAAYAGAALVVAGLGGWLAQVIQEHPTFTARLGNRVESRVVGPFGYPVAALAFAAVLVVSISRLYLAISEHAAIVISGVVATALFLICVVAANGKDVGRKLTGVLGGLAAVAVVSSGIVGAANGERVIEAHPLSYAKVEVEAEGIQYAQHGSPDKLEHLDLPEGAVRLTFKNHDPAGTYHDIGIYDAEVGGTPFLAALPIDGGKKGVSDIDTKAAGMEKGKSYFFRCDFHPAMVGTLSVTDAPVHESAEGHGGEGEHK